MWGASKNITQLVSRSPFAGLPIALFLAWASRFRAIVGVPFASWETGCISWLSWSDKRHYEGLSRYWPIEGASNQTRREQKYWSSIWLICKEIFFWTTTYCDEIWILRGAHYMWNLHESVAYIENFRAWPLISALNVQTTFAFFVSFCWIEVIPFVRQVVLF